MNIKNLPFILAILMFFSACQKNAQQTNAPLAETTATNSETVSPTVSTVNDAKTKTYDGIGVVMKINLELVSVELKHEEIKGLMPAMQMEFYVSDKKYLENLKIGDKVDFVLENSINGERIVNIKKNNVR